MPAVRNRGLLLAAAGIALLLAATFAAYRPVAPLGADAPPTVFSAHRATAILQDLVGNGVPHPPGRPAAAELRDAIVKRFSALGYAPELQSGFVCNDYGVCGNPVNIVVQLAGSPGERNAVLLAAHYDSVPAGPGASDDGAAVASLLEIARILKALPAPRHPIVLLMTDGEEAGLLGAWLFVREHPLSKLVKAAVNLDARGTSGPSLMFETGAANTWLMRLYQSAIVRPVTNSLYYVVYRQLPNDTDFTVFKQAGYQGFNFAFIGNVGRYHTPLDNVVNADRSTIQHQGANGLAALTALANAPSLDAPAGESVFFDGYSRTLIAWRSELTLPAALLALILLVAEAAILWRGGAVTGRQILQGWVGILCALASAVVLCAGLLALLIAVHKVPALDGASWVSQPLPMNVAAVAISVLAAGAVSVWLARRAGFWGFWVAAALQLAVLCVVTAVFLPGASYIFLLTTVAAGLAALPCAVSVLTTRTCNAWALDLAALLPALTIFGGCCHCCDSYTCRSAAWHGLSTLVTGFATTTLPLLAVASGRVRNRSSPRPRWSRQAVVALCACLSIRLPGRNGSMWNTGLMPTPVSKLSALRLVPAAREPRSRRALRPRAASPLCGGCSTGVLRRGTEARAGRAGVAAGLAAVGGARCRSLQPLRAACTLGARRTRGVPGLSGRCARCGGWAGDFSRRGASQSLQAAQRRNLVGDRGIAGGRRESQFRCGRRSAGGGSSL
jgi:hypothetical protein